MRYRTNPNGTIEYPVSGKPPPCPEDYMPDSENRFRFVPIIKECKHRQVRRIETGCCGTLNTMHCGHLETQVSYKICHRCTPEWLEAWA